MITAYGKRHHWLQYRCVQSDLPLPCAYLGPLSLMRIVHNSFARLRSSSAATATDTPLRLLLSECDSVIDLCVRCPPHRDALQRHYDSAVAAMTDFALIATLGRAVQAATTLAAEGTEQAVAEDYQVLVERHDGLTQRVEDKCRELVKRGDYDGLSAFAKRLIILKALSSP
jgi:hypothetical protein